MSNEPSARLNCIRCIDARLQAVSSRNMYSEHGFDALMRPPAGQVCQSLMVVSYCTPGSAQAQAACATLSYSSRAPTALATLPSMRRIRFHSPSASTVRRNSSDTTTEALEFWPDTVG